MSDDDDRKRRSIQIVCGLQDDSGGFLATSGDDAYPFMYPRDATFMTMALNMHGLSDKSMRFYKMLSALQRPGGELYQRYNRGFPCVSQKGEADVTPIVIQGVLDTYLASGDREFLAGCWTLVEQGAGFVVSTIDSKTGLVMTGRSVHEFGGLEEGFEIWANSAAARGLVDASRIASLLGDVQAAERWLGRAKDLWGAIQARLYDRDLGVFIKNLRADGTRIKAPDVSQVAPFYFGLCPNAEMLRRSLEYLRENLWNEEVGGYNRFRDFEVVADWHWYTGGTGASWPLFTLPIARLHKRLGNSEAAGECLEFVKAASNKEMGIPEKVAPHAGYMEWRNNETQYNDRLINGIAKAEISSVSIPGYVAWACPLGWSQAEYLMLERKDDSPQVSELLGEPVAAIPGG